MSFTKAGHTRCPAFLYFCTFYRCPRLAPCCALPQAYPLFAYRGVFTPLLCSYRGAGFKLLHPHEQAPVDLEFLTLASIHLYIEGFVNCGTHFLYCCKLSCFEHLCCNISDGCGFSWTGMHFFTRAFCGQFV